MLASDDAMIMLMKSYYLFYWKWGSL